MNPYIETDLGNLNYTPGERISGRVGWPVSPGCHTARLRLLWFTEGKGDRDVAIVDETAFDTPAAGGEHRFDFTTPEHPPTFSGRLVSLTWALELTLEPSGKVHRLNIVIAPNGREIDLTTTVPDEEAYQEPKLTRWMRKQIRSRQREEV